MSSRKRAKKRRRASRTAVWMAAGGGLASLAAGLLLWPGMPSVLLGTAAVLLLCPLALKRRPRRPVFALIACGCLLLAGAFCLRFARVNVGFSSYPRQAQTLDLRGRGLTDLRVLAQFPSLEQADLRDNPELDTVEVKGCEALWRLDVRGCGLTQEQYQSLCARLPGCLILCEQADTLSAGERVSPEALEEALDALPGVRQVNLTGSLLTPEALASLRERFPDVRFYSEIQTNGQVFDSDAQRLALRADSYEEARALILQFTRPEEVSLTGVALTAEQALELSGLLCGGPLECELLLGGQTVGTQDGELTFSGDAEELLGALPLFGSLRRIELTGEATLDQLERLRAARPDAGLAFVYRGVRIAPGEQADISALPSSERARLQALCPEARLEWREDVLGRTVSSLDTVLDFGSQKVTDDQVRALYEAIGRLPNLEQVLMYESRLSTESMDRLFDAYPGVFFGWTVTMDTYTVTTDITAFSTLKNQRKPYYTQDDMRFLRYCRYLQALDLGHNKISDISFLSQWPHLKVLILADNCVSDLSVLSQLTELEYVELFMNQASDLSPLASLGNLKDLNLCYNLAEGEERIEDVTPLYACESLERCWLSNNGLTREQQDALRAALPLCEFNFTVEQSTDGGWRKHPRYDVVRDMMQSRVYTPFE